MIEIPQAALLARDLYARGATMREIVQATGFGRRALYVWIDGGPRCDRTADSPRVLPPLPRRRTVARQTLRGNERAALVARMMRAAERQVREIEDRIGAANDDSERNARTLAVLARTMRELIALDTRHGGPGQRAKTQERDDDPVPRDVDELRRRLARRLDELVAESKRVCPDEA